MPLASLNEYIALAAILFSLGGIGVLIRRSPLTVLMAVELMWNAANLLFISFARMHGNMDGNVMAFLVITVAAAEVAIGLALIVLLFRKKDHADVDDLHELKN